ncbi:HlyIII-domain-containing protein [Ascodesmis nigricans]|uniref:HlyIII-domain-containing protein n=1 Tax=Ascodesmis nigricans TaxID=341454 RepID=A0A4S2MNC9_9PEZI|nr:HlyIII-domain-containing protein [Ascodesmis nigricans]
MASTSFSPLFSSFSSTLRSTTLTKGLDSATPWSRLEIDSPNTTRNLKKPAPPLSTPSPRKGWFLTPPALLTHTSLPTWYHDNPFLPSSYRPIHASTSHCLRSLLYLHNESLNIYTHLLPALLTLYHVPFLSSQLLPGSANTSIITFFLFSTTITLLLSSAFHTMSCHSQHVSARFLKADYLGIVLLNSTCVVTGVWEMYRSSPQQAWKWAYTSLMAVVGTATVGMVLLERCQGREWRGVRIAAFIGCGMVGVAPVVQVFWEGREAATGVRWYLLEGALLLGGAAVYALRVPERFAPGRFDIYGHSHQVFHCMVVAACVAHLTGLVKGLSAVP